MSRYRALHTMIVIVALTIAAGAVLLWSLYSEQVAPPARRMVRRWTGLPAPTDVRRRDFPLVLAGYDQRSVDAHLHAVAEAVGHMRARLAAVEGDGDALTGPSEPGSDDPGHLQADADAGPAQRAEQVLPRSASPLPAAGTRPATSPEEDTRSASGSTPVPPSTDG